MAKAELLILLMSLDGLMDVDPAKAQVIIKKAIEQLEKE